MLHCRVLLMLPLYTERLETELLFDVSYELPPPVREPNPELPTSPSTSDCDRGPVFKHGGDQHGSSGGLEYCLCRHSRS